MYMMDCRPSDLIYIMSTPTTYYQLPVLLVKLLDIAKITKISTLTLKLGHFRWEKNQLIIYYLSVNYIKWFQQKKSAF